LYERVFILEMSGPTLELLRERLDRLPNFRRFFERGARSKLVGPLQPVVPTAFGTLFTGKNPGKTSLFDFFRFPAGGYERYPYSREDLHEETFYERLSRQGRPVGLLNVPLVHPLPEIEGFVVSGDEGIGEDYARPSEVLDALRERGYSVPFGASYSPGREIVFLDHALEILRMRRDALRELFGTRPWDLGMLTVHLCGEILHSFWKFYDRRHPGHRSLAEVFGDRDPVLETLAGMDALLGEIVEMTGPDGLVMVLGAWGHRLEHSKVFLNGVLARHGWLRFKRGPASLVKRLMFRLGISKSTAERLAHRLNLWKLFHYKMARGKRAAVTGATFLSYNDIDWARTRAVATGYHGQVFLNVQGHRPAGVIATADYDAERRNLRTLLEGLEDPRDGSPVVDRVWAREEIYSGPGLKDAPDLIVHLREGYSGESGIAGGGKIIAASPANHSSDHWNESFFLALGPGLRPGEIEARLEDIAPTVLRALGVDPAPDHDGKVLPILP